MHISYASRCAHVIGRQPAVSVHSVLDIVAPTMSKEPEMVTRLLLIFLCLSVLSTVPGCSVEPTVYGTASYGGGDR